MSKLFLVLLSSFFYLHGWTAEIKLARPVPSSYFLSSAGANYHFFEPPSSLIFPGMEKATRVAIIYFTTNKSALRNDHIGFGFPIYTNGLGSKIIRGVIIGTTSNNGGRPCLYPTIYFESFTVGKVTRKEGYCPNVLPNTRHRLVLHASRNWIYYRLYRDISNVAVPDYRLIDEDEMNASGAWSSYENAANFKNYNGFRDLIAAVAQENSNSKLHILNVQIGHYMNDQ